MQTGSPRILRSPDRPQAGSTNRSKISGIKGETNYVPGPALFCIYYQSIAVSCMCYSAFTDIIVQ